MHCHGNHALQHSQQVLSVCESRGFAQWSYWHPHLWWRDQELSISIAPVVGLSLIVSPCARSHTLIQLPSPLPHPCSPLSHSRSSLASHPLQVGCYPVASEVGCGSGVRFVSRRRPFANLDHGGPPLREDTTLIASCTLMSAACENSTTWLSRCLVEPGTAVIHDFIATWPNLLKLSDRGTSLPHNG